MEYVVYGVILILTILLLKLVFKINFKELKKLEENEELKKISDKFPENIDVAKEYLEMLDNKDVTVEEAHDTKTSLYIAITNKIIIADMRNNYGRLQVIAHECIHSIQERTILISNFIVSNILLIYFLLAIILTILKVFKNIDLQIFILTFISLIQYSIRSYLETDAMLRSKVLVKEYMGKKKLTTKKETEELLAEYEKINKVGVPFVIDNLLTTSILRILTLVIVAIIAKLF